MMQARRDAGEFDPRPQVDPNEETVRLWAEEALQRENRVRQATDLAEAQKQAEKEALEQREAFERARAVQLDSQRKTSAADGASPLSDQIDMTHLKLLGHNCRGQRGNRGNGKAVQGKVWASKGTTTTGSAEEDLPNPNPLPRGAAPGLTPKSHGTGPSRCSPLPTT